MTTRERFRTFGRLFGFSLTCHRGEWTIGDRSSGERPFHDGIRTLGGRLCPIGCECSR